MKNEKLLLECNKKQIALSNYSGIIKLQRQIIHKLKRIVPKDDFYKIIDECEHASEVKLSDSPRVRHDKR